MTETTVQIDAAAELASWTRRVAGMYAKDLKALSQEQYQGSCGGVARTAHDFTAEVCGFNLGMVGALAGGDMNRPSDEEQAQFKASLADRDTAVAKVIESGEMLAAAEMTQAPWGEPITYYQFANIATNHILYHDGQLNVIQSVHGDGEMHWFDE
jgi:hypothetical protein